MTVSSTTTKNSYSGNGSTTTFAYGFKIFADADLTVILRSSTGVETVQSLTTHYTVTNAGNASGGNVVFGSAPASGVTVVIRRNMALTQSTDYVANDPFPAATHEDALDRLTFISQQMQEEVDRTIKLSRTNTMTSTEFTVGATDRASKVLAFDSSGELSVTQELGTFKGSDATVTTAAYVERDIIKSTTTAELNNVYICVAASVVGDSLTDTDHFALLVDAVSAASSATTATTKASEAATSATNAANSASTASTQASNASTSASTASTQATNAANSATAAASSAASAATALDNFDDIFLGAKSSDPTTDNDGDALNAGDLYFNTTSNQLKVFNGSSFQTIDTFTTGISSGNVPVFTSGVADNDFLRVDGTSIEGRSASEVLSDIGASPVAGSSSIVTTGALDSGSITSGFGNINNGTSTLTTGNTDINGTVAISGDTTLEDGADLITASAGTSNVRIGVNAGNSIQSGGNFNTVVGDEAGTALTTGDSNVAVGFEALKTEDTHSRNTAIGHQSLKTLNAGANAQSTAVGYNSAKAVTTGIENVFIGASAGETATTPNYTVAVGKSALGAVLTGDYNTAVGYHAGIAMTSGQLNTLVGATSGDALTIGITNVAYGYGSLTNDTAGNRSTAIGYNTLQNQNLTTSTDTYNTAVGFQAGKSTTTGTENTLVGGQTGDAITTGIRNVAVGKDALSSLTTGSNNIAVGFQCMVNGTGDNNTAMGWQAMLNGTGSSNSAFGREALENVTGSNNTAVGFQSGQNITSGNSNTCIGRDAGDSITTGGQNSCIGFEADVASSSANNTFTLGNSDITTLRCNDTSISSLSDQRDKTNIQDLPTEAGLSLINSLRPVTFNWDRREWYDNGISDGTQVSIDFDNDVANSGLRQGFIAQEVATAISGIKALEDEKLVYDINPDKLELAPAKLITNLVKAIQELSAKNDALETRIKTLEG